MPDPINPIGSSNMNLNPYDAGQSGGATSGNSASSYGATTTLQLASVLQRFFGFVIDGLIGFVAILPGMAVGGVGLFSAIASSPNDKIESLPFSFFVGIALIVIGSIAPLIIQCYFLATRSQSIGKMLLNIQIVDFETGQPASIVQTIVMRTFVVWFISTLPCIGFFFSITDAFFVFRQDRRCIHDLLASTVVIDRSVRVPRPSDI